MAFIKLLATGINNEHKMIAALADHQIIDDATVVVSEKRIALPFHRKAQYIDRHEALQSLRRVGHPARAGAQYDLSHM